MGVSFKMALVQIFFLRTAAKVWSNLTGTLSSIVKYCDIDACRPVNSKKGLMCDWFSFVLGLNIPLSMLYGHLAEVRCLLMILGFVCMLIVYSFSRNYYMHFELAILFYIRSSTRTHENFASISTCKCWKVLHWIKSEQFYVFLSIYLRSLISSTFQGSASHNLATHCSFYVKWKCAMQSNSSVVNLWQLMANLSFSIKTKTTLWCVWLGNLIHVHMPSAYLVLCFTFMLVYISCFSPLIKILKFFFLGMVHVHTLVKLKPGFVVNNIYHACLPFLSQYAERVFSTLFLFRKSLLNYQVM